MEIGLAAAIVDTWMRKHRCVREQSGDTLMRLYQMALFEAAQRG